MKFPGSSSFSQRKKEKESPIKESDTYDYQIDTEIKGPKDKFQKNVSAIRIMKKIISERRKATQEEKNMLSLFTGWGGIPEAFDADNKNWEKEYNELRALLNDEEYTAAQESTLTSFYTPANIIAFIYQALEHMGFHSGRILEPACGTGRFIRMLPKEMNKSSFYGVEIDSISGRIAQLLHPESDISVTGFENTDFPDNFFDLIVGNIPFGEFRVFDKKYEKNHFAIHDYFFAKSLDKLRPGGIIAFVTSSFTMDKANNSIRKYIAKRADLIGAIRLPVTAFKTAGTKVVSDILFLQKRKTPLDISPEWIHLNKTENGLAINEYYLNHPKMVLGKIEMASGPHGPVVSCVPGDIPWEALLPSTITALSAKYEEKTLPSYLDEIRRQEKDIIPAEEHVRNYSFTDINGTIYFRENNKMRRVIKSKGEIERLKGLIQLRDCTRDLIQTQLENSPDEQIQNIQKQLNNLYDAFTEQFGHISSKENKKVFFEDDGYWLLSSLEELDQNGNFKNKTDIFFKRTIRRHEVIQHVENASEALAVSLSEKSKVDMDYMSRLSGKTPEELETELAGLIFRNIQCSENAANISPTSVELTKFPFVTADEYLSGNVRKKLRMAKTMFEVLPDDQKLLIKQNITTLEAVQPQDLRAEEIIVNLGATWIPSSDIRQFMNELLKPSYYYGKPIDVHLNTYTKEWYIEGKSVDSENVLANTKYGTKRCNAYHILEDTLNLKEIKVFDNITDEKGQKKRVLNLEQTQLAQEKQDMIKEAFQNWIWSNASRKKRLVTLYNETFNATCPREYDGSHLTFPGMNEEIRLRSHQVNAIARILYGGNTLLAHKVGAGKTFEMVAAAMKSKQLGLCKKSLISVPNHIVDQFASEFMLLYPSANILVTRKEDFIKENRKRFCARIATGDYDAIIISHSQFEKIPMSLEYQKRHLEERLDEVQNAIEKVNDHISVKQLERTKKSVLFKLNKLNQQTRKDNTITFEELGVDRLFVDEAHNFKNLFFYTKMHNVSGISQTEAQKSSDLFMKCRYLDSVTNSHGVIFATGTPISNSMAELYTMQRYLQFDMLQQFGIDNFDAWASIFGETITAMELKPEGSGYRLKTKFAKFNNLPELVSIFREIADIQTEETLRLPVPKVIRKNISIPPSPYQLKILQDIAKRADAVRKGSVKPHVDNMLKITNDGRKLALEQRLLDSSLPANPNSKVFVCAKNVAEIWNRAKEKRSAQIIFCDISTPKQKNNISTEKNTDNTFEAIPSQFTNVYEDLKQHLIEQGIPKEEIAFIHDADTDAKKAILFSKVRNGQIRILIGSTSKMGAGTNVQNLLIAEHHLDCPWRPSDLEQREGRIIRQGNENPEVEIYTYLTERTFDAYMYQLIVNKQKIISQIMTCKTPIRSATDVDEVVLNYSEIMALASGNPQIMEKCELENDINRLQTLYSGYLSQQDDLKKLLESLPLQKKECVKYIDKLKQDIALEKENTKIVDKGISPFVINGNIYTDGHTVGDVIEELKEKIHIDGTIELGTYRGFHIFLQKQTEEGDLFQIENWNFLITGNAKYYRSLGDAPLGYVSRINNLIHSLPQILKNIQNEYDMLLQQENEAKAQKAIPFPHKTELEEKKIKLKEVNKKLGIKEDKIILEFSIDSIDNYYSNTEGALEKMELKGPLQNEQEIQDMKQRISLMEENISSDPGFALQGVKFASLINLTGELQTYAYENALSLFSQYKAARYVMSREEWEEMGCQIGKKEPALKILRPLTYTYYRDPVTDDWMQVENAPKTLQAQIQGGILETTTKTYQLLSPVFDISQTNCPVEKYRNFYSLGVPAKQYGDLFTALSEFSQDRLNCPVFVSDLHSVTKKGHYNVENNTISLSDRLNDLERITVLAHELGHSMMAYNGECVALEQKELVADTISIMLLSHFGVPVSQEQEAHFMESWQKYHKIRDLCVQQGLSILPPDFREIFSSVHQVYMEQLPDIQEAIDRKMENQLEVSEEIKNELERYHGEPVVEITLKERKETIFLYGAEKAFEYLASGPARKIPYQIYYEKEGVYNVISGSLDTEKYDSLLASIKEQCTALTDTIVAPIPATPKERRETKEMLSSVLTYLQAHKELSRMEEYCKDNSICTDEKISALLQGYVEQGRNALNQGQELPDIPEESGLCFKEQIPAGVNMHLALAAVNLQNAQKEYNRQFQKEAAPAQEKEWNREQGMEL